MQRRRRPIRYRRYDLPWGQGLREDEADDDLRATQEECDQRGNGVVDEFLELKIFWVDRGGRGFVGAIHRKFRRYVARAPKLKYESVGHRFQTDTIFRQQMIANGWRQEAIGRINREAKEHFTPVHPQLYRPEEIRGVLLPQHCRGRRRRSFRFGLQELPFVLAVVAGRLEPRQPRMGQRRLGREMEFLLVELEQAAKRARERKVLRKHQPDTNNFDAKK